MKLLLDTHLLLWTGVSGNDTANGSLPTEVSALIKDETNALYFSPASIWEVAIKNALGRADFRVDPHLFRRQPYWEIARIMFPPKAAPALMCGERRTVNRLAMLAGFALWDRCLARRVDRASGGRNAVGRYESP